MFSKTHFYSFFISIKWKNAQVICCQESWDDIRYNAEQHTFLATLSIISTTVTFPCHTGPERFFLFPMKICADLQWVETSVPKSLVSSGFSQGRGLDLFSSAEVSTSEKKYAQPVLALLCQEAEMEWERLPCHSLIYQDSHYSPRHVF